MSDNVTLGEVYRLCQRIDETTQKQNGRIRKLEDDNVRIKAFWSAGALMAAIGGDWLKHKLGL
jgi:hypothetical protein